MSIQDKIQTVLVTGGSGRLGRFVVEELKKLGFRIRVMDVTPCNDPSVEFIQGDITSLADAEQATRGIDAVIHLAAIPVENGKAERIFRINVTGTFNVLEASARNKVKGFVYASSVCVYGLINWARRIIPPYFPIDENTPRFGDVTYSMGKIIGEDLCHGYSVRYKIDAISLRIATVMFDESPSWPPAIKEIDNPEYAFGSKVPLTQFMWQYVNPKDVAQAFALSVQRIQKVNVGYEAFNIGAKDVFSTVPTLELIGRYYADVPEIHNPAQFIADKHRTLYSITKAREVLGYEPKFTWRDHPAAKGK